MISPYTPSAKYAGRFDSNQPLNEMNLITNPTPLGTVNGDFLFDNDAFIEENNSPIEVLGDYNFLGAKKYLSILKVM